MSGAPSIFLWQPRPPHDFLWKRNYYAGKKWLIKLLTYLLWLATQTARTLSLCCNYDTLRPAFDMDEKG